MYIIVCVHIYIHTCIYSNSDNPTNSEGACTHMYMLISFHTDSLCTCICNRIYSNSVIQTACVHTCIYIYTYSNSDSPTNSEDATFLATQQAQLQVGQCVTFCIYTYTYICICVYIYIHICMYKYIYM